ncbi:hypothetical protein LB467_02720 [Salegentibacter sp. JZCK2]|uniref:hypothetical protein n=1 Tax=Salegentibacter tibetensis TaxID=2873600 RepID=UPI001CCA3FF9|nr:hypothetical protein [Salegentibacter tibetensis]MBZ9728588.1 hypothetical protein [Salegentibacter tibetensis]
MEYKTVLKVFIIISLMIGITGCREETQAKVETLDNKKEIATFNFDNKRELSEYKKLELDKTHPNLLNPAISKSEYKLVVQSWTELHQKIGDYLSEHDFNWEIEDTAVSIVHKIYFKPNGEIENYFFNVLNENVSKQKKKQFASLVSDFARDNHIEFKKDEGFAQCGKTRYFNE